MFGAFFAQGALAYAVLGLGFVGLATGLLALALARTPNGKALGMVSLAFTLVTSTVALVAVTHGRATVEIAAAELPSPERERAREKGYADTREIAEVGLGLCAPALALGAAGTLVSLARRRRVEPDAEGVSLPLGVMILGGLSLFSVIALSMPLVMGLPGERARSDDAAQGFARAEGHLSEGRLDEACNELDAAFRAGAQPDKARAPHVEALVSECFTGKLAKADAAPTLEDRTRELGWLEASKLPLDEGRKKRLADERERARELGSSPP